MSNSQNASSIEDQVSAAGSHPARSLEWLESDPLDHLRALRLQLSAQGEQVFDLSMFNPDLAPPRFLLDKLLEASFKPQNHRYAISRGVRKLREAFAHKYQEHFAVKLDPETQICATMGTKDALVHGLMVMANPGDTILLSQPTYPGHLAVAKLAGLKTVFFKTQNDEAAMLQEIKSVLAKQSVKVVLLNFPNNPTGKSVSRDFYVQLLNAARPLGVCLVNDFVYGEMGFGGMCPPSLLSACNANDIALESYSLSKAYNVAGWRVGALMGNAEIVRRLARLKAQIDYGIFLPVQFAASAALTANRDLVGSTVAEYEERCRVLSSGLQRQGWEITAPSAGGSIWAKIPQRYSEAIEGRKVAGSSAEKPQSISVELARQLLERAGILITPGILFGKESDFYVRFTAVAPLQAIREVLARMEGFEIEL